jgi:hypothetical protein
METTKADRKTEMNQNTGPHSIRELEELTKDLKFFRYYPATSNFNPGDGLKLRIVPANPNHRTLRMELRERFIKKYPRCSLDFPSFPEKGYLLCVVRNGEEWGDMKPHHFEDAVKIERELENLASTLVFGLVRPE